MSALVATGVDADDAGLVLSYALNTTSSLVSKPVLRCLPTMLTLCRDLSSAFSKWLNRTSLVLNAYYITSDPGRTRSSHEILDTRPGGGLWPSQGTIEFR